MQNTVSKKVIAWIAIVAVLFVMLFSTSYISHHAEHNCTGEDCPICAVITQCVNNLRSVESVIEVIIIGLFIYKSLQEDIVGAVAACISCSLISQKVRMNN